MGIELQQKLDSIDSRSLLQLQGMWKKYKLVHVVKNVSKSIDLDKYILYII